MRAIIRYSRSFDPLAPPAGLRAVAHRGPDDSGTFVDRAARVGLGQVRLCIIDRSPLGHPL